MSCTTLGFDDYGNLRVSKSQDTQDTLSAPSSYSFDGWTGTLIVRANDDNNTALLTVTTAVGVDVTGIYFSGPNITVTIKAADLAALPENADDTDQPWVGVCEFVATDPDGLASRITYGAFICERGVVR